MPLLPLDKWRELLAWNPWHFSGLADSTYVPVTRECSDIVYKYSWQGTGAGSREDIALAIEEAERKFRDYMFFWPAPRYTEDTAPFPAHYLTGQFGLGRFAVDGRYPAVTLPEGYIQALGTEKLTLVGAIPALAGRVTAG